MKKHIPLCLISLFALFAQTGCANPYQQENNVPTNANKPEKTITMPASNESSVTTFTAADLTSFENIVSTGTDSSEKIDDYDMNGDGKLSPADIEIMRREILGDSVNDDLPVVYMTKDISREGLMRIYMTMGWENTGKTAVKLSTGEPPASNYLRPEHIKDVVEFVDGTIVECNTAYGGSRSSSAMHYQIAEDHGFTEIPILKFSMMKVQ